MPFFLICQNNASNRERYSSARLAVRPFPHHGLTAPPAPLSKGGTACPS
jgi:hypothetical protein